MFTQGKDAVLRKLRLPFKSAQMSPIENCISMRGSRKRSNKMEILLKALASLVILCSPNACIAQKRLDVCDFQYLWNAYAGKAVPEARCSTVFIHPRVLVSNWPDSMTPSAEVLGGNGFHIGSRDFAEVYFESAGCRHVAITFARCGNREVIHTRAYPVDLSEMDLRTLTDQEGDIWIMRRIPAERKGRRSNSLSIVLDKKTYQISRYSDVGLSYW